MSHSLSTSHRKVNSMPATTMGKDSLNCWWNSTIIQTSNGNNETKRNEKMRETLRRRWQRNQTKPNRIVSNEKRMCKHAHSTVPCIKHWLSQIEGDKLVASNDTWNNSYKHTTCCKCAWHIRCCVPSCPRPIHAECVCNDHFRLVLCEDLVRQLQFIFVCLLAITNIIEPVAPLYIVVFGHFWLPLSSIPFHLIRV